MTASGSFPGLFAASHVLHRLWAPRHPPHTLGSLTATIPALSGIPCHSPTQRPADQIAHSALPAIHLVKEQFPDPLEATPSMAYYTTSQWKVKHYFSPWTPSALILLRAHDLQRRCVPLAILVGLPFQAPPRRRSAPRCGSLEPYALWMPPPYGMTGIRGVMPAPQPSSSSFWTLPRLGNRRAARKPGGIEDEEEGRGRARKEREPRERRPSSPAPKSPDSSGGLRWPCGVSDRL